ncbi:hypothetical protein EVAR_44643_1, partial [Eumeta japonica]
MHRASSSEIRDLVATRFPVFLDFLGNEPREKFHTSPDSPYVIIIIEYLMNVTSSCFSKKKARDRFFLHMEAIDARLGVKANYYKKISRIHYVIAFYSTVLRVIYILSYCWFFNETCIGSAFLYMISGYILLAVDINQLPRVAVFGIVRYKMNLLRQNIELHIFHPSFKIFDKIEIAARIRKALFLYKDLLDAVDDISAPINRLYFMSLLLSFPKIMLLIYNILLRSKSGGPTVGLVILCMEVFQVGLLPCLPGIATEMVAAETDKIKLTLMHRRLWTC